MNVSLTEELERKVEDRVRSGMYGSASEVVREALRLFFRYDEARMRAVDDLDHRISIGLAELDRGLGVPGSEARRRSRLRILDRAKSSVSG
jgi:antitoxin ParD1/3/4